jgi:hypothetical protein
MGLIKQSIQYEVKNFWEANPQLVYMFPFSALYEGDESKDKEVSSKNMWCVYFMCDPDEEENLFYRMSVQERIDMLKVTYNPEFDEVDELIALCVTSYPDICLNAVERALKNEKDALTKRADFLVKADYNFETMKDLDNAFSKTSKIYENFENIEERFLKHKSQSRVKGGRNESASEKGHI